MRKILLFVLLLLVVLVGAAVAAPFVLPQSFVKAQVVRLASDALGRKLAIDGELTYVVWPPLSLRMTNVRLADMPGTDAPMAAFDELDVEVDALAWLDGVAKIDRVRLVRPTANLRVEADGTPNWQLSGSEAGKSGEAADASGERREMKMPKIVIGQIAIEDGHVSFHDLASGMDRAFEQISLDLHGNATSGAIDIQGSVTQGGKPATLQGSVADAAALATGHESAVDLRLEAPGAKATLAGSINPGSDSLALDLKLDVADLRGLAAWAGQALALPEGTLAHVALEAGIAGSPAALDLAPVKLTVDDLHVEGDLAATLQGRPRITGSLAAGPIVLDAYLPPPADTATAAPAPAGAAAAGWPDEPLDLPLPLPADIDLVLTFEGLKAGSIALGAGKIELFADSLTARAHLAELALYDGKASGTASIEAQDPPKLTVDLDAESIRLLPLLQATAQFDRLEGRGGLSLQLASAGNSVKALIDGLDGNGSVMLADGAILGINIGAILRSVATLGVSSEAKAERRTDFAEMGGTFAIAQGILSNRDFALRAPLLRIVGEGEVDLPAQTLDYRLTPQVAATIEGQGAAAEPTFQAGVPIAFSGPWADPAFKLDIGGALTADLKDPAAFAKTLEGLAADPERLKGLRDQIGLGGGGGDNPVGALVEGLLGGKAAAPAADTPAGDAAPAAAGDAAPAAVGDAEKDGAKKVIDAIGGLLKR